VGPPFFLFRRKNFQPPPLLLPGFSRQGLLSHASSGLCFGLDGQLPPYKLCCWAMMQQRLLGPQFFFFSMDKEVPPHRKATFFPFLIGVSNRPLFLVSDKILNNFLSYAKPLLNCIDLSIKLSFLFFRRKTSICPPNLFAGNSSEFCGGASEGQEVDSRIQLGPSPFLPWKLCCFFLIFFSSPRA